MHPLRRRIAFVFFSLVAFIFELLFPEEKKLIPLIFWFSLMSMRETVLESLFSTIVCVQLLSTRWTMPELMFVLRNVSSCIGDKQKSSGIYSLIIEKLCHKRIAHFVPFLFGHACIDVVELMRKQFLSSLSSRARSRIGDSGGRRCIGHGDTF